MGVKLQSALGGSVELNAPSTASNFAMTVPAGNGTVATTDQLANFRNRLHNGDMRIHQRGGTITVPTNNISYALDRWIHYSGAGSTQVSRVSSGLTDFPYAMQLQPQTSCNQINIEQRMEAFNVSDLIGVPVTYTGKVYIDNATGVTFRPYWYYPSALDNWASVTFVQLNAVTLTSGTYIDFSVTFTPTTATVNGLGVTLEFTGSLAGKTIKVTGLQVEKGTVATPFERRPYSVELALCQRYFCSSFPVGSTVAEGGGDNRGAIATAYNNTQLQTSPIPFPVSMRISPTITYYRTVSANAGKWTYYPGGWYDATPQGANSRSNSVEFQFSIADTRPTGACYIMSGNWSASAEL
jgi:hypothetical protein